MLCLVFVFWYVKVRDDMDVDAFVTELKPLKNISSSFTPDTFETVRDVSKALTSALTHGYRKDFFHGGPLADCSTGNHKNFSRGSESDEISFFLIETKKMTFFAKNAIDKFQTSKSRGKAPLPTPIILGEFTVVLYDCYGCTRHRDVASVGEWCPAPHLKSVPPISCLDPRLLHISNIVFKNVPPCGFCPPPAAKSWRRA